MTESTLTTRSELRNVKRSFLAQTKIISNGIVAVCKEIKSLEVENMWVNIKHIFTVLISLKDNYLLKAKMSMYVLQHRCKKSVC